MGAVSASLGMHSSADDCSKGHSQAMPGSVLSSMRFAYGATSLAEFSMSTSVCEFELRVSDLFGPMWSL